MEEFPVIRWSARTRAARSRIAAIPVPPGPLRPRRGGLQLGRQPPVQLLTRYGANQLGCFCPIPEQDEQGDALHAVALGDGRRVVDIQLDHLEPARVLTAGLFDELQAAQRRSRAEALRWDAADRHERRIIGSGPRVQRR